MTKRQIINEAIISQSDFLMNIINLAKSNPKIAGNLGKILSSVEKDFKEIESLQGKKNKKSRNQLLIQIHNELKKFNGTDGTTLDFKGIRPLYDSIYQFILKKSEVNIDDCILASDYFMKNLYNNLTESNREKLQKGKFPLEEVFELTEYYKEYEKRVEDTLKYINIFENEEFKIVYPQSYHGFVKYIKETMSSAEDSFSKQITWCTQGAKTYADYSGEHYLMIYTKKNVQSNDPKFIVSFKVMRPFADDDGEYDCDDIIIDYEETCDRFNEHMSEDDFKEITPAIRDQIIDKTCSYRSPEDMSDREIKEQLYKLYRINAFDKIYDFLSLSGKEESIFNVREILKDREFLVEMISSFLPKIFAEEAYVFLRTDTNGKLTKQHKNMKTVKFLKTLEIFSDCTEDVMSRLKEKVRSPRSYYEEAYLLTYLQQAGYTDLTIEDANAIITKVCNTNNERTMIRTFIGAGDTSIIFKPENHRLIQESLLNSKHFLNYVAKHNIVFGSLSNENHSHDKLLLSIALSDTEKFAKIIGPKIVEAQKEINRSEDYKVREFSSGDEFIKDFDDTIIVSHVYNKILGVKNTKGEEKTLSYLLKSDVNDINMLYQNWTSNENVIKILFSKALFVSKKVFLVNAYIDHVSILALTSSLTSDDKKAIVNLLIRLCEASRKTNLYGGSPNLGFVNINFKRLFVNIPGDFIDADIIEEIASILLLSSGFDLVKLINSHFDKNNTSKERSSSSVTLQEKILESIPKVYWNTAIDNDEDIFDHTVVVDQAQRASVPDVLVSVYTKIAINGKDLIVKSLKDNFDSHETFITCLKLVQILTNKNIAAPQILDWILTISLKESEDIGYALSSQQTRDILKNAYLNKSSIEEMLVDLLTSLRIAESSKGIEVHSLKKYCEIFEQALNDHTLDLSQKVATDILLNFTSLRSFAYSNNQKKIVLIKNLLPYLVTTQQGKDSAKAAADLLNSLFRSQGNRIKNICQDTLVNISKNASSETKEMFKNILPVDTDTISQMATASFGGSIPTGTTKRRKINLSTSDTNESILRKYIKSLLS